MILATLLSLAALAAEAQPAAAAPVLPSLNLEQETAVRCASAFAIVSAEQAKGSNRPGWPNLGTRGREFFVRTGARLMDETGATRPAISALFARTAGNLRADANLPARLESLRQPCLTLLDLAIPAG